MTPMVPHQRKYNAWRNPGKDALSHLSVTRNLPIQAPRCTTVCYSSPHLEGQHQRRCCEGVEQPELTHGWWKCKTVSTNFEQYFVHFSWKKICLSFSSTVILLSSSAIELWTCLHKIIHICVYGSFVDNCLYRKQPQCLSTYKWV